MTLRTLARFGKFVFAEREPARPASRGLDHDTVTRRAGGPKKVPQILGHVAAVQAELAREGRRRPRFGAEQREEIFPKHDATYS
jgi:hypothetical protein